MEWQPIATAPEYIFVLVYEPRTNDVYRARLRDGVWSEGAGMSCWLHPTHWMPLPPPPQMTGRHGTRDHPRAARRRRATLGFWGVVLAALVTFFAGVWP